MNYLSYDTTRCLGQSMEGDTCQQRESCARYTQRDANLGERTPFTTWACADNDYKLKIEVTA